MALSRRCISLEILTIVKHDSKRRYLSLRATWHETLRRGSPSSCQQHHGTAVINSESKTDFTAGALAKPGKLAQPRIFQTRSQGIPPSFPVELALLTVERNACNAGKRVSEFCPVGFSLQVPKPNDQAGVAWLDSDLAEMRFGQGESNVEHVSLSCGVRALAP